MTEVNYAEVQYIVRRKDGDAAWTAIASGGVTNLDDIRRLSKLGLAGCIIGRALYEGRIDLAAAVALARKEAPPS